MKRAAAFESPLPDRLRDSGTARIVSFVYGLAIGARNRCFDSCAHLSRSAGRPVISIGAIRAGGTGKTPVTLMTAAIVRSAGWDVAFLSRGYGRRERKPQIIKPGTPVDWEHVGDEPAMLRSNFPESYLGIGPNRVASARILDSIVPARTVYLLDDGFQHRRIRRDLDIVCLHESALDDVMLPRGFLREPVSSLSRASLALLIGQPDRARSLASTAQQIATRFPNLNVAILHQVPRCWVNAATGETSVKPPLRNPVLVCGIARPKRFIELVEAAGVTPSAKLIFPDHHPFTSGDLHNYRDIYSKGVVTTEKDAVRLQKLKVVISPEIWYLKIELSFSDPHSKGHYERQIESVCHS